MGAYLSPWNRKVGVLTLGCACLFAAGWVRSLSFEDTFTYGIIENNVQYSLTSCPIGIRFVTSERLDVEKLPRKGADLAVPEFTDVDTILVPSWWNSSPVGSSEDFHHGFFLFKEVDWRLQFYGIDFGQTHNQFDSEYRCKYCLFPYWSIVIPLTLLSAWLLLSKPAPAKPKSPIENHRWSTE